jgi:hypothetical protein
MTSFHDFEFFCELEVMCENGFKYFKIADPMDNVCDLAGEILFTKNIAKVIKDTYADVVVTPIEVSYLTGLLSQMTLENTKILISGKNLT